MEAAGVELPKGRIRQYLERFRFAQNLQILSNPQIQVRNWYMDKLENRPTPQEGLAQATVLYFSPIVKFWDNVSIEGLVVWHFALVMAVAAIPGGYVGARIAKRLPPIYIRGVVITVGLSMSVWLFFKR